MTTPRRFPVIPLIMLIAVLAGGGFYWWYHNHHGAPGGKEDNATQQRKHSAAQAAPVQAATAMREKVPHFLTGLGTVTATNTATVRSRVAGDLLALHFNEGQQVNAGQLLAEIDPRPYQVALMQAEGQQAKDRATLANARRDLARFERLAKTGLVAQQELDTQRARVEESLGTLKADAGSVASAQLNMTYSRIIAPIAGRVGLKQVDIGNYLTSSDSNGIVVITQTRPIDLLFSLPENDITRILAAQKNGPVSVEAWDRANQVLLATGTLLSMDNQIDTTTATVRLKARFTNQDDRLFPNQFVNARLKVSTQQDAIVIPAAALQMGSDGNFVWVVNSNNKVSKKTVSVGLQDSQRVVIEAGLEAGEQVVTDGIDRLTDGTRVEVVPAQTTPLAADRRASPAKGASD